MALPTRADLKTYLRIETASDDDRLDGILAQATQAVETWLDRPITAVAMTFTDEAETCELYGSPQRLVVPIVPIASNPAVAITDRDGTTVETAAYRVDRATGMIRAEAGLSFSNPPYTIAATVGLSAASDYATRIEPVLSAAIIRLAAHYYHKTNPAAQAEGAGGGIYTQYGLSPLMPRDVESLLQPFRLVRVA